MTAPLFDIPAVVDGHHGHSRVVLDYTLEMKRIVDRATQPGFDASAWDSLGAFVAVDTFTRVGPFKDEMTWPEYVDFLTDWAPDRYWECSLRRITEVGSLVFLELEERLNPDDPEFAVNSLSVFELDAHQAIRRLDVYLQMNTP